MQIWRHEQTVHADLYARSCQYFIDGYGCDCYGDSNLSDSPMMILSCAWAVGDL